IFELSSRPLWASLPQDLHDPITKLGCVFDAQPAVISQRSPNAIQKTSGDRWARDYSVKRSISGRPIYATITPQWRNEMEEPTIIVCNPNGPLRVTGNFVIRDSQGKDFDLSGR